MTREYLCKLDSSTPFGLVDAVRAIRRDATTPKQLLEDCLSASTALRLTCGPG